MEPLARAAVVGAGVIGAGWTARLALHGIDVAVIDPDPATRARVDAVLLSARTAWNELGLASPHEGAVTIVDSVEEGVHDAQLVQESAPEDPSTKTALLARIDAAAPAIAIIASSTSGLRPTVLQAGLGEPGRLVVGHPFNPVYLMPLVEVCGGEQTTTTTIDQAMEWYRSISMHPLLVRVEIDAFIADRLMEAVWREALGLLDEGVATTSEIDDAIRFGFGLRWAQMGLFETYRIAGGDGGMAHFLRQFGPTLSWPWSRLTDVPELTDDLVALIAAQSDAQSGAHTIGELERIRDRNLVGILRALEANGWGAGETLARQRRAR